jgi:hypothetical protein
MLVRRPTIAHVRTEPLEAGEYSGKGERCPPGVRVGWASRPPVGVLRSSGGCPIPYAGAPAPGWGGRTTLGAMPTAVRVGMPGGRGHSFQAGAPSRMWRSRIGVGDGRRLPTTRTTSAARRPRTMMPPMTDRPTAQLAAFCNWARQNIAGGEKGEAQIFLDRLLLAFGYGGARKAGCSSECACAAATIRARSCTRRMSQPSLATVMRQVGRKYIGVSLVRVRCSIYTTSDAAPGSTRRSISTIRPSV